MAGSGGVARNVWADEGMFGGIRAPDAEQGILHMLPTLQRRQVCKAAKLLWKV